MPVHLTGRMSDMKSIMKIAKKYKIKVVEDSAQSIGSKLYKKMLELLVILDVFQLTR